jgi:GNAT superfamily N-acetyltransferase
MLERALMAETSTWDFDWTPPGMCSIDRPDVRAWCYDGGWAGSRGVGRARWMDDEVPAGIEEIKRFFEDCGLPVRWYVGPSTRSALLVDQLRARAAAVHEPRLMTAEIDAVRFARNEAIEIREVSDVAQVRAMIETAFPEFPTARSELAIAEKTAYLKSTRRGAELLAYVDGELVGFANWRDSSDGRCVQLVGAWTKPSHRGRGIYSTLTAFRCDRARERGLRYAAIVADPTTSGPIVAKAGFVDHGPLLIFVDPRL